MSEKKMNMQKLKESKVLPKESYVKKPPVGLKPKTIHDEEVLIKRFNDVCGAISRYYNAGYKIDVLWIEEYNELIDKVSK